MPAITVNADDFGWDETCTKAILSAFEKNFIQTTTMMANGAYFDEACEAAFKNKIEDQVGVHFVLTDGKPLTDGIYKELQICNSEGIMRSELFPLYHHWNSVQKKAFHDELTAQVLKIKKAGFKINHADSHHHIHTSPTITPIVIDVLKEQGIEKLRVHRNIGNIKKLKMIYKNLYNSRLNSKDIAYSKFFGSYEDLQFLAVNHLLDNFFQHNVTIPSSKIITSDEKNILEIMCHPDFTLEGQLIDRSPYCDYAEPVGENLENLHKLLLY